MEKALVLGASGFLGSHVVKQLVEAGQSVRIFTRASSDTRMIDDLELERRTGDIHNIDSLIKAMSGCDVVYDCIVDTRSWIRDATPLYRTNINGTQNIVTAAIRSGVRRFVFTSSIATIGLNDSGMASEQDAFNWWQLAPEYVKTRVVGEKLVQLATEQGLDAVICNVATTYGEADYEPTPHGRLAQFLALGKMPVYWDSKMNLVGIKDAARGLILAAEKGQQGERYLISDRLLSMGEFCKLAAEIAGKSPPKFHISLWLMRIICAVNQTVMHSLGKDTQATLGSLALSMRMDDFDNGKAKRELGWEPRPLETSLREAADWFKHNATRT